MRVASIDCGTNSIRLLIAEVERADHGVRLRDLQRHNRIVRLGQGVDATGRFADEALERTFAAAEDYATLIREYGVERIRFGATSATRDAANREVFLSGIEKILGVRPEVITGNEEAALSFAGAVSVVGADDQKTLVLDLGGGSTEFVLGTDEGIISAVSMDIGSVRLTERHAVDSPVNDTQRQAVIADVDAAIETALHTVDIASCQRLVGVAGTVTTVTAQALGLTSYDAAAINGTELTLDRAAEAAQELAAMSRQQRIDLGFIPEGRADVIGTGALIWARILEKVGELTERRVTTVLTSESDILDGLALSLV
ncbi:Ppx/GppA phosphatase family protein [Rothia sp. LK2588]|uniref:Ppx/GppA phosphatase family protein n=1 Tax=Rothia sp. LK2588 TaxID=3114369 RepID=UPI0034CE4A29